MFVGHSWQSGILGLDLHAEGNIVGRRSIDFFKSESDNMVRAATSASVRSSFHTTSTCDDFSVGNCAQYSGRKLVTYRRGPAQSTSLTLPCSRVPTASIRSSANSAQKIGAVRIGAVEVVNTSGPQLREVSKSTEPIEELLESQLKLPTTTPSERKKDAADDDEKVSFPFYAAISNKFCDTLESVLLWALYGSTKPTSYYLVGNYVPVEESAPQRVLSVKGHLPECLNGEYIKVCPNPKVMPLAKYHWFDGDGMLHGLRIKDGEVTYASRYVRTSRLKQEEYWGAPKFWRIGDVVGFGGLLTMGIYLLRQKLGALDASEGDGTANTALVYHNGTLFALCETDMPYAVQVLDSGDFKTISRHDFDKKLDHPFTAHPKIDPDTGEMFSCGYSTFGPPYLTYNVISKDGKMGDPVAITLSSPKLVHDFAIAGDYAVFMDCPLHIDPKGMVMKGQSAVAHSESTPFRFGVLPKYAKDETEMRWFEFTSAVNFHIANGWQEGEEIVLLTCRMPTVDVLRMREASPRLYEYRINLRTGETSETRLAEFDADMPRINENYTGKKNRYVYTVVRIPGAVGNEPERFAIIKYDLTKEPELGKEELQVGGNVERVFWYGHLRYGNEPLFVPSNCGTDLDEDDGYILTHVFDENTWKSEVLVLDAKTLSPDPIAVVEMPSRVPYGFHSVFVSEEQLRSQLDRGGRF